MSLVKLFHPCRLILFTMLSIADLGLTYALIQGGDGRVYESNPVAEAWLSSYGWTGLILFKLAIILIVAAVVALVSLSRPRTGGRILTFACVIVALVVSYSAHLQFAERMHARYMASPTIVSSPRVRLGWNASALQAHLPRE